MLDKRISHSQKIALVSDKAKVVYLMLLPHLDKHGCYEFLPWKIKGNAMPLFKKYSEKVIEASIVELNLAGLVLIYESKGDKFLHYMNFRDFQTNDIDREGKTDIPKPKGSPSVRQPEPR